MTVLIYVDTSKQVGDPNHLKVFAAGITFGWGFSARKLYDLTGHESTPLWTIAFRHRDHVHERTTSRRVSVVIPVDLLRQVDRAPLIEQRLNVSAEGHGGLEVTVVRPNRRE